MQIAAAEWALPQHRYSQEDILQAFKELCQGRFFNAQRVEMLHKNVLVGGRNFALPLDELRAIESFGQANDAFIREGLTLGEEAIRSACEKAGLAPDQLDAILFTTVTGLATPSIDALLTNRMPLASHIARMPFFGLGCVGGAAGLSRCRDWLLGHPDKAAVLLSVELCSLTLQRKDLSIPNLISTGLFGDGAAAVVAVGDQHPLAGTNQGPRVRASRSVFFPDTEAVMGWTISESGFEVVLSAEVPDLVQSKIRENTEAFLKDEGLELSELTHYVCHPGGPKVLKAIENALDLDDNALAISWESLKEMGNLSSASVLINLSKTMSMKPPSGSLGLLLAMGPGFCAELVLLEWP